jgi:uncharacterized membrane protein
LTYAALYAATLAVFLLLDLIWLRAVAMPMFRRHVGPLLVEEPNVTVAVAFYALYVVGLVYFAVAPAATGGGAWTAFLNGALFGFFAYGTYEATNMATLKGWRWSMVASDVGWGAFVSGASAALGLMIAGG